MRHRIARMVWTAWLLILFTAAGFGRSTPSWAAVEFSGSSQYASIADNNNLTPTKWAISFWLKQDVGASLVVYNQRASANSRIEIFTNGNGLLWCVTASTGTGSNGVCANGGTHVGQWHRWVAAWDGAQVTLYKDGTLLGATPYISSQGNVAATAYLGSQGGSGYFLDGRLSEVAIWDLNQVSLATVVSLTANSLTAPQTGLKALWRLNDFADGVTATGSGSLRDSSGNNVHATPVNSPIGRGNEPFTQPQDTTPPTGSVTINAAANYANTTSVTLTLSATDAPPGSVAQMQFSNDGATWLPATPANYATAYPWSLSTGDGTKTVYAKFKDAAGNWSQPATDTITLDTASPTGGSIVINANAQATNNPTVTLTLSAADSLSGVSQMRFANDTCASYSAPDPYATSKTSWALSSGDGSKTVCVQFADAAGNWSAPVSDTITLDTTPPTLSITSPLDGAVIVAP